MIHRLTPEHQHQKYDHLSWWKKKLSFLLQKTSLVVAAAAAAAPAVALPFNEMSLWPAD